MPQFPKLNPTELVGADWEGTSKCRGPEEAERSVSRTTLTIASQPQQCHFPPSDRRAGLPSPTVGAGQLGDHVHALQGALQCHHAPETPL